jgi:GNAT superfamily N-acetyltransferase
MSVFSSRVVDVQHAASAAAPRYVIARADASDIPDVAALIAAVARELYHDPELETWLFNTHSEAALARKLVEPRYCLLTVRELTDPAADAARSRLIATAYAWAGQRCPYADADGHLGGLHVGRDVRRQGLGRMLLEARLEWLQAVGCKRAWSEVDVTNQASLALFTNSGFTEHTRVGGVQMQSVTWAVMTKKLNGEHDREAFSV